MFSRANTIELTGAVAIAESDHPNRFLSDKLLRLIVKDKVVNPSYLLFALRSPAARAHIERCAGGTSDSMRNISLSAMLRIPIALPDIEEQKLLAERLTQAFCEIAIVKNGLKAQLTNVDLLPQRILAAAFGTGA